jgi:hypothetical protein
VSQLEDTRKITNHLAHNSASKSIVHAHRIALVRTVVPYVFPHKLDEEKGSKVNPKDEQEGIEVNPNEKAR